MEKWEVILQAGVEGGAITLYGMHNGKSWIFSEDVYDQTPALIDEPDVYYRSKHAYSWQDALQMLDKHPWHLFYPLEVHPFFRGPVLAAVLKRSKLQHIHDDDGLRNWLERCGDIPQVEWKLVL